MLIRASTVKELEEFKKYSLATIERKLKKIEQTIHSNTHNNFISNIKFKAKIKENAIYFDTKYIKIDDTVLIDDVVNKGFYTVENIENNTIKLKEPIFDSDESLIIKIVYPADVIEGALDMLEWDLKMRGKVGIKSETLSRHSLTYFDMDSDNSESGYPISLLGFLKPYKKARF